MSDTANAQGEATSIDPVRLQVARDQLRSQQSLPGALLAGLIASLIGAGVWAAVTVATEVQIGWMAVGVGFLVGIAVRTLGKGMDPIYGIVGACFSLLGCAVGNLLAGCGIVASQQDVAVLDVLAQLDVDVATGLMTAMFSPIDLLFYGLALYQGHKLSFRRISEGELLALMGERAGP